MNPGPPITLASWPRAILHVDADAFFASCEQAVNPELRGKPVITGKERGIVAAASYEAKARGIKRGMRLFEVRKVCPEVVILPSDYESYSLFSSRMFSILRRFSPDVEEYSIDEAFVDLTGLRRSFHGPYTAIASEIKETIAKELGITVSIGVSLTKVLAKIGSKKNKPNGLTPIPGRLIHEFLHDLPAGSVWGIGPNTTAWLEKLGVRTALEFARLEERFVEKEFPKPLREIWHELNGRSVYPVTPQPKAGYQSISKARTFTPPSVDREFVFGQLSKNLENACIKARRHSFAATRLIVLLRTQEFRESGVEIRLTTPASFPGQLLAPAREGFDQLFRAGVPYRQTGVVLAGLVPERGVQYSLFDNVSRIEGMSRIYKAVDELSDRFGKHTVQHGSSLPAKIQARHEGDRGDQPERKKVKLKGETLRQRLGLPMLRVEV